MLLFICYPPPLEWQVINLLRALSIYRLFGLHRSIVCRRINATGRCWRSLNCRNNSPRTDICVPLAVILTRLYIDRYCIFCTDGEASNILGLVEECNTVLARILLLTLHIKDNLLTLPSSTSRLTTCRRHNSKNCSFNFHILYSINF